RIHALWNYGHNPLPHADGCPELKKESWLRRVLGIQKCHKHVTTPQARFQSLAERFARVNIELVEPNSHSPLLERLCERPRPVRIEGRVRNKNSWFVHRCHPFCCTRAPPCSK